MGAEEPAMSETKTILVVEDELDVQIYLKTVLEEAGFEVVTANNGKQALDRIQERRPDLISLDLEMPQMRGVKLLAYLQRNRDWANIPFLIVTSHARDDIGRRDLEEMRAEKIMVGPHTFVEKPIVPAEYVGRVRAALRSAPGAGTPEDEGEILRERILARLTAATTDQLREALRVLGE
jgi:two-component system, OmpR family, alkaline phosphatase synthesis response regulator PhoP